MQGVEQELIATALPYWEAEAAIVRRFFGSKPTREDHIFWLKAQLWKELHPVDGYFTGLQKELNNLVADFPEIDKTIDRHRYHSLLEQLTQEFNHYVLMADVLDAEGVARAYLNLASTLSRHGRNPWPGASRFESPSWTCAK